MRHRFATLPLIYDTATKMQWAAKLWFTLLAGGSASFVWAIVVLLVTLRNAVTQYDRISGGSIFAPPVGFEGLYFWWGLMGSANPDDWSITSAFISNALLYAVVTAVFVLVAGWGKHFRTVTLAIIVGIILTQNRLVASGQRSELAYEFFRVNGKPAYFTFPWSLVTLPGDPPNMGIAVLSHLAVNCTIFIAVTFVVLSLVLPAFDKRSASRKERL